MALTDKLTNIADAIRTKNGTSAKLSLDDMASSILAIESGSGTDTSDATATAENIESGYTAYVKGERITGSLETGVQANLLANRKTYSNEGSVKYITSTGTSDIDSPSHFNVSYKNRSKRIAEVNDKISAKVRASLFGNATVNDVVKGKTFSSENGLKLTGTYEGSAPTLQEKSITPSESSQTVTSDSGYDGLSQVTVDAISSTYIGSGVTKKSATTYTPGTSDQTIASGQYLNGVQTIKGDSNLVAGNIKSGVSIFGVSGSYASDATATDTSDATVAVDEILTGKTAYARGAKITGTMPNKGSVTGNISAKAQKFTIAQGYHDGSGYVQIATTEQEKLIATNIRQGVTILGVEGSMSGSEGVVAQAKTVTPTTAVQTVMPDDGYTHLSQVTVNPIPYAESDNSAGGKTVTIG